MNNTYVKRLDTPHRLHLETTKYCNMRCEHCYVSSDNSFSHPSIDIIKNIIKISKKYNIKRITLTGGEFLTRPDSREILKYIFDVGFTNIYFISNGLAISKDILNWIAKIKTKHFFRNLILNFYKKDYKPITFGIGISLDGFISHGKIRKNNQGKPIKYYSILRKLELIGKYGIFTTVNTVVSNRETAYELYNMYRKFLSMNIDRWQIDQLFISGRSINNKNIRNYDSWIEIAKWNYQRIIKHYIQNYSWTKKLDLNIVQLFRKGILTKGIMVANNNYHPCGYQFGSIISENDGDIRFCPSLRYDGDKIFNINDKPLSSSSFMENSNFNKFSQLKIDDLPCKNCKYKFISHGGCRANSQSYYGKIYTIDPICCELSPFFEKEILPLLPKEIKDQYTKALYNPKYTDKLEVIKLNKL
ncbi:radical SAM protein with 4Fe4S-binding SPASM domain [Volucribacter psittacicida]|uniref:Radical SAM protein with 4Fe4S-binding SPASM domain n=1 Tax=Volucribacter psittacicida TaxID=203482 RepID=A0A4R1G585_9PAST|nr:radical SAM protein [Volucribacter psittacicida]TCJ98871.1 radical SAM protein with 4Fe4S-binding SPASM domain [Volucribacter psittacicida]